MQQFAHADQLSMLPLLLCAETTAVQTSSGKRLHAGSVPINFTYLQCTDAVEANHNLSCGDAQHRHNACPIIISGEGNLDADHMQQGPNATSHQRCRGQICNKVHILWLLLGIAVSGLGQIASQNCNCRDMQCLQAGDITTQ